MGYDVIRFTSSVYEELICAICQDVFANPVQMNNCDHIFCKTCINDCLKTTNNCPLCRRNINNCFRSIGPALKMAYDYLEIHCRFQPTGCDCVVPLINLEDHESICEYSDCNLCERGCGARLKSNVGHHCITYLKKLIQRKNLELQQEKLNTAIQTSRCIGINYAKPPKIINEQQTLVSQALGKFAPKEGTKIFNILLKVEIADFRTNNFNEIQMAHTLRNNNPVVDMRILNLLYKRINEGSKVLLIGSQGGYFEVCCGLMVGYFGKILSGYRLRDEINNSITNINKNFAWLLESKVIEIYLCTEDALFNEMPFDVIYIDIVATQPEEYTDYLKPGGELILPVYHKGHYRPLQITRKEKGKLIRKIPDWIHNNTLTT